jgi:hypothetical protein
MLIEATTASAIAPFLIGALLPFGPSVGSVRATVVGVGETTENTESTIGRSSRAPLTPLPHLLAEEIVEASYSAETLPLERLILTERGTGIDGETAWHVAFTSVDEIAALPDGWDGDGSRAASPEALREASALLISLSTILPEGPAPLVGLDSAGTVVLTLDDKNLKGSMSVFGDGTYAFYVQKADLCANHGDAIVGQPLDPDLRAVLLS